jgi:hypothetical protein
MAARYSYSSSPYDQFAQYQYQYGVQSGPRRFFSAVGRFFYRLIVLCVILGVVGGLVFALYRNGVLLTIARGAGVETAFRDYETRLGAKGWNSIVFPHDTEATAPETASAPAKAADIDPAKPETVHAVSTTPAKASTPEGLPIASLDSLPTLPAKGAAPEPVPAEEPAAAPVKVARAEPTRVRETPRAARAPKPKPQVEEGRQAGRSIPLIQPKAKPKPEPEPVAKAEPPPKPEPKAAPEPDPTTPRASDNPLKAAIRAAMTKK